MNSVIWKYQLKVADESVVEMPEDAQILTVQVQNGESCLWAIVDPNAKPKPRKIYMYGTGAIKDCDKIARRYIGTVQHHGGSLVFHVFEHWGER